MTAWKIYFWLFTVVTAGSAIGRFLLFRKSRKVVTPYDLVEAVIGILLLPGLYGFAYGHAIGIQFVWEAAAIFSIGNSVAHFFRPKMRLLAAKGWQVVLGVATVELALGLPALYALFRYAFLSPVIWHP
jgi:hypothetical protein